MIRTPRVDRDALFEGSSPAAHVRRMHLAFIDAVAAGSGLDPVVAELVRLRGARTHDCRVCQAVRYEPARQAGVDEPMLDKIDDFEASDLPERVKVALRLTDAFIRAPSELSPELVQQARGTFTDDELMELCLQIVKNSSQKIGVALGTDENPSTDEPAPGGSVRWTP